MTTITRAWKSSDLASDYKSKSFTRAMSRKELVVRTQEIYIYARILSRAKDWEGDGLSKKYPGFKQLTWCLQIYECEGFVFAVVTLHSALPTNVILIMVLHRDRSNRLTSSFLLPQSFALQHWHLEASLSMKQSILLVAMTETYSRIPAEKRQAPSGFAN